MASYTINYAETPFTIEEYQYGYDTMKSAEKCFGLMSPSSHLKAHSKKW